MIDSAQVSATLPQVLNRSEMAALVLYLQQKRLSEGRDFPEVLSEVSKKLEEVMDNPNFSGLFSEVSPLFILVFLLLNFSFLQNLLAVFGPQL